RRLIRRAVRHGRILSLGKNELIEIAKIYIDNIYKNSFPLLTKNREFIIKELTREIERFEATIENGMKEMTKILDEKKAAKEKEIDGAAAFYLYDTFGFPLELTIEMAAEDGLVVDEEGFKTAMEEQKKKAREGKSFAADLSNSFAIYDELPENAQSEFTGYDEIESEGSIIALSDNEKLLDEMNADTEGVIITDVTPFYGTMGGQKGDRGVIKSGNAEFEVFETVHIPGGRIGHVGKVVSGTFKKGEKVELMVDKEERQATCRNHSATHLLQKALQDVLGDHVEQSGSYQDEGKTRFDFTHHEAMTAEELKKVEKEVNEKISECLSVDTKIMSLEDAKQSGAMALFGEKYADEVRVVGMGDFSKELCGGTHVKNTGEIKVFKILSESGVAAGIRRIEAITGDNVLDYYEAMEEKYNELAKNLKTSSYNLAEKITNMYEENENLKKELEKIKKQNALNAVGDATNNVVEVKGVKLLAANVPNMDMNGLRDLSDKFKAEIKEGVVVLLSEIEGKVSIVVTATDEAMKKGVHSGNLIKQIAAKVGGGGGGRPNMASAGGKNPAGIPDAIKEAKDALELQIK
ncbi:MAG: alanine--tRNA ligase, partial [Lachnospiraceae bacterium]|nr:alanine--tRNA ligase [Lachnospiraceae bacterium]